MKINTPIFVFTLWFHLTVFSQTDPIIDTLFMNSFEVFNQQRLSNGMYRDAKLFSGADYHPISISNTGMGLISLCIADSMGWIDNAPELVINTLETVNGHTTGFTPDRTSNGFFRHFLNTSSGLQEWNSEYSTIDTGILIAGALFCKNYFQNDAISNLVNELWNSIDFQAAIANSSTGKIYLSMNSNGTGISNSITSPYSEYMIVAWLAKNSSNDSNSPGNLLWKNYYKSTSTLPIKTYKNHSLLSDSYSSYLPSFTHQFNYYLCHYFSTNTEYKNYFKNAQLADKAWWSDVTENSYEWGLGAGNSVTATYNYHADAINNNPDTIVSPHIIAGYIPINPESKNDLINIWNNNKGKYVLPTNPQKSILWRYSKSYENWKPNGVIGIDYSSMLFGIASLDEYLGKDFFSDNNNFFSSENPNTSDNPGSLDEPCQQIHLPGGWFTYSSYVQAENRDAEIVMNSIDDQLLILKDNMGNAYLTEWGFNGIGELDFRQGYQIKTNAPDILEICGLQMHPEEHEILIEAGWNSISYLKDVPTSVEEVMQDLTDNENLIILKDYEGMAYFPDLNFNGIGNMQPGQGYKLKSNTTGTINYPADDQANRPLTYEPVIALKDMAPFPIGMSVQAKNVITKNKYSRALTKDFNSLSAEYEMKMDPIYKGPNQYDFSGGDAIVSFAKENGFRVFGHALVWHAAIPNWLNNFDGTDQEFENLIETYIKATVTHFAQEKTIINDEEVSVVAGWDVVNEAFTNQAENAVFRQRMGEDYVAKCFTWAREADPNVKLFYNDYNLEFDFNKVNQVTNMIDDFKANGIPIDGVGLQTHINISYPPIATFQNCLDLLLEKDVLIHFSEIDMTVNRGEDITELTYERALEQEKRYKEIVDLYFSVPADKRFGITVWGLRDTESWLLDFYNNPNEYPLLFDENFNHKIAHRGFIEGLHQED